MPGYTRLHLIGNIGRDPELRMTVGGTEVLNLRVACNQKVKRGGEWIEDTTWVSVTVFGKRAAALSKILRKGEPVFAEGRPELRVYDKRDGSKGADLCMIADEVVLLGGKHERSSQERHDAFAQPEPDPSCADGNDGYSDDDIPF